MSYQSKGLMGLYLAAAFVGAVACGKSTPTPVVAPPAPPAPTVPAYNPNNTQSGCVGNQANTQFVSFGGSYDYIREQYMPSYQCMFGNIHMANAVNIGSASIAAGTYTWQAMYDQISTALRTCCIVTGNSGVSINVWASMNWGYVDANFNNRSTFGGYTVGNSPVTFDRAGVSSDFQNILSLISSMNWTYYYAAGYTNYVPYNYYGGGSSGTNIFGGLSYNSNGGLSFSLGGSYSH